MAHLRTACAPKEDECRRPDTWHSCRPFATQGRHTASPPPPRVPHIGPDVRFPGPGNRTSVRMCDSEALPLRLEDLLDGEPAGERQETGVRDHPVGRADAAAPDRPGPLQ